MRIDFHSHILPQMDDGSKSTDESIALLQMLVKANVDTVVLTPHFYRNDENIASFLKRRSASYDKLVQVIDDTSERHFFPQLVLGAEVLFTPSLSSDPDFEQLCIEGTDYILLELPFQKFHDNFYSDFVKFLNKCNKKIILAHIERYLHFGNTVNDLYRIIEAGDITCQMNCSSIAKAGFFERNKLFNMINDGIISALGTDTHNTSTRPPMYEKAEEIIRKKCGEKAFERICDLSKQMLAAANNLHA